jgi:hypothetical protein
MRSLLSQNVLTDSSGTIVQAPTKTRGIRLLPDDDTRLSGLVPDGLFEAAHMPFVVRVEFEVASWPVRQVNAPPDVVAFVSSQHIGREESAPL